MSEFRQYDRAIHVGSVEEETQIIRSHRCHCGGRLLQIGQRLDFDDQTQKHYDRVDTNCMQCGSKREFIFDISSFFGRKRELPDEKPPTLSEPTRGMQLFALVASLLMAAIAAFVAFGPARAYAKPEVINVAYFLMVLFGLGALLVYSKMSAGKGAPSADVHQHMDSSPYDVESTLRDLGLPLDFSVSDPGTALTGGFAKATLLHGYKLLEANKLDEAISAFTTVTDHSGIKKNTSFSEALAVAHYLRGNAYERKQMTQQALADYTHALDLSPDHSAARQAYERLRRGP